MSKYVELGEIRKGDKGEYIKLTNYDKVVITVNGKKVNGANIYINPIEEKFRKLAELGHMSEEEAEDAISKIPDYVLDRLVMKVD